MWEGGKHGGRGGPHLSLGTPVCCTGGYRGPVCAPAAARRDSARCFTMKQKGGGVGGEEEEKEEEQAREKREEEEEEEEVALARQGVTFAYVNHIEARTI